jgi:WW domain-containing oxidoreductase
MTRQSPTSKHLTALDIVSGLDLSERRIIVTGANSGIGFETARALARAGASVLLACRDRERGMAAQQAISAERPEGAARFEPLDLASLESVRRFCASPEAQAADSVICNAGVYAPRWQATADGFELTLGVCHLGHFLLVRELLPGMLSDNFHCRWNR